MKREGCSRLQEQHVQKFREGYRQGILRDLKEGRQWNIQIEENRVHDELELQEERYGLKVKQLQLSFYEENKISFYEDKGLNHLR